MCVNNFFEKILIKCGELWGICVYLHIIYWLKSKLIENQYTSERKMTMRFIGDYGAKTDAKGRAFLPAPFRKILDAEGEKNLVLRSDVFQKCLVLYPESVWNAQLDSLRAQVNQWNSKQQMMLRKFEADAEPIELDSNGRLLISKRKLQYAGIESEVRFLAMVDRIEIWSKQALEELMSSTDDLGHEMEEAFGKVDN